MKGLIKTKKDIRERTLALLRSLNKGDRLRKTSAIVKKFFKMPEFKRSNTILFYASFDGEVETVEMIKQALKLGKKIGLPRILRNQRKMVPVLVEHLTKDLEAGSYGIKQPKRTCKVLDLNDIDLVVVPGVAFDKDSNRLGRGQGYYDRFLKKISSRIPTVGLAFDFQIVNRLPKGEHDVPVSHLISN